MQRTVLLLPGIVAFCLLPCLGCGQSGPVRGDVQGKVTVDGESVENGAIVFTPLEGIEGAPMQYEIKGGTYSSAATGKGVPVGKNSVYISGTKPTGRQSLNFVTGEMSDDFVEYIPAKYNERTTLEVEVEDGNNTFDFELEGKPTQR